MRDNLLATKFHRPPLPANWVRRPGLTQRLNKGLDLNRQITLVSAPAGFGKTTCITEWLHTLETRPTTWLSLEPSDDDPRRFWAYFITALHKINPLVGREVETIFEAGQLPHGENIATTLINDIFNLEYPFLLVLDDFHVIQDQTILQGLGYLVQNHPQQLHLVLITREDPPLPLARLRANNLLTEIRASDLRFTRQDIERFLNNVIGLSLAQPEITLLENKTEGWIAGLQLAGLSIQERTNPADFIATLSGSQRSILSYLTEQVLNQQPEEIQQFLIQSSILEKLNGDLCNAITGHTNGRALLKYLLDTNLFLIPLDDERRWYRYHYLFADLLRELQHTLEKETVAELHRNASNWYIKTGMINEAIQHALAAEDYTMAVALLEKHAMDMIMQGYVKTVDGWMQAIPEKWQSQSPRTNLTFAWMHLLRGAYAQALPAIERLRKILAKVEGQDPALKAEWLVIQSLLGVIEGIPVNSLALAQEAVACAPARDSWSLSLAYFALASAYPVTEASENVISAYRIARQHSRAAHNQVIEMLSTSRLAGLAFERGQLHLAYELAIPSSSPLQQADFSSPINTVLFGMLGEVYLQWYQLEQARENIERASRLSTLGGYQSGIIGCQILHSRLAQLAGDLEAAGQHIQQAADMLQVDTPEYVRLETISQQVRIYLARKQSTAAEMVLQGVGFSFRDQFSYPELPLDQTISYSAGLLFNSGLHVLLYHGQVGEIQPDVTMQGIGLANQLIDRALKKQYILVALDALILRAGLYAQLGDTSASTKDYISALALAEPEGFIGVFVEQGSVMVEALTHLSALEQFKHLNRDYVERLNDAFPGLKIAPSPTPLSLAEPLTQREIDVLRLMVEGLKYREIAARLFISVNTVRYHVKAVYRKLNVSNRTQAIEAARQHHIL